ncbi:MAG TPA: peptidoglycan DD-metalloendopeptidase family protein [Clostridia bacterium]|nr:peptidoglycan DD-metalloendopeptidase family protein [Clostridia bacterium]
MKKFWQRGRIVVGIVLVITAISGTAFADKLEETKNQLQKVEQQIKQQQNLLNQTKKQEKNVLAELESLENSIEKLEKELADLDNKLKQTETQVAQTENEIAQTEQELEQKIEILNQRLRDIYENGNVSYLEVILGAESFSDFVNRMEYLQLIFKQDVTLFEEVKAAKEALEAKKQELEKQKREILAMKTEASNKKAERELQVASRGKILEQIRTDKETYERMLDELEQTSRELELLIRQLQGDTANTPSQVSGKMAWPTAGRISSYYGMRTHPIFKTKKMHTGLDIAAPSGQNIVAAESGKVIYSSLSTGSWMGGYGNTVIIDHGGGISTLYGHTSKVLVRQGETVKRGQVIAKVGSTGNSTGPHLHFEVRVNGVPKDPLGWL